VKPDGFNLLTPNVNYSVRTAPLTSKVVLQRETSYINKMLGEKDLKVETLST